MLPAGYIAHRIGDRVRVRIPERKGDAAYFMRVERDLTACERVIYVEANPLTASILLRYAGANDDLRRDAINLGLFAIEEMPPSVNPVLTATSESDRSTGSLPAAIIEWLVQPARSSIRRVDRRQHHPGTAWSGVRSGNHASGARAYYSCPVSLTPHRTLTLPHLREVGGREASISA